MNRKRERLPEGLKYTDSPKTNLKLA